MRSLDTIQNPILKKFFAPAVKRPLPVKAKPKNLRKENPRETPQEKALRDALAYDRWRFQAAEEFRARRLASVRGRYPSADRFLAKLKSLTETVEAYSARDCNLDLCPAARKCRLDEIEPAYDRFTVYEEVARWLGAIAKAQRVGSLDDDVIFPDRAELESTTLGSLKLTMKLT